MSTRNAMGQLCCREAQQCCRGLAVQLARHRTCGTGIQVYNVYDKLLATLHWARTDLCSALHRKPLERLGASLKRRAMGLHSSHERHHMMTVQMSMWSATMLSQASSPDMASCLHHSRSRRAALTGPSPVGEATCAGIFKVRM